MKLLSVSNAKTVKGETKGFRTFIMHLAPGSLSGHNVCPMASKGCLAACLNTAGRGIYINIQDARIRKTQFFHNDRAVFMAQLVKDVESATKNAIRADMSPVFRLNGTSDIRWENIPVIRNGKEYANIMLAFPTIQFYDYTKLPNRRNLPANYHLTFSRSESNAEHVVTAMENGMNVAVVFATLPATYLGRPVINGDETDLRFTGKTGVVIGLKAKGKGRKDMSGFVVRD